MWRLVGFSLLVLVLPGTPNNLKLLTNPTQNVSWQVLSELLADLDACDSQKGDTKVLANGEVAPGKFTSGANLGNG